MQDLVQRVHLTWRQLKAQFRWTLVEDEAAFVDDIVRILQTRPDPQILSDDEISTSIKKRYNRRLYEAMVAGLTDLGDDAVVEIMNRASHEIYLTALWQSRRREHDPYVAEEIAQKVVMRLIERPHAVREPESLTAWITWQIRDLLKTIRSRRTEQSLDSDDGSELPLASVDNLAQQVDDALLVQQVLNELPKIVSAFQQRVIELVFLEEQSPIEAAAILGVKPSQIRAEKSRAIHKIRRYMAERVAD